MGAMMSSSHAPSAAAAGVDSSDDQGRGGGGGGDDGGDSSNIDSDVGGRGGGGGGGGDKKRAKVGDGKPHVDGKAVEPIFECPICCAIIDAVKDGEVSESMKSIDLIHQQYYKGWGFDRIDTTVMKLWNDDIYPLAASRGIKTVRRLTFTDVRRHRNSCTPEQIDPLIERNIRTLSAVADCIAETELYIGSGEARRIDPDALKRYTHTMLVIGKMTHHLRGTVPSTYKGSASHRKTFSSADKEYRERARRLSSSIGAPTAATTSTIGGMRIARNQ